MGQQFGLLQYDVPLTERALYNKLRSKIRRYALPLSSSAYLIPWGFRDAVNEILEEIQSEKPNVINSGVHKFDDSEEKALALAAERSLNQIVTNTTNLLAKRLQKAEEDQAEIVQRINEVKITKASKQNTDLDRMLGAANDQFEITAKRALSQAEKALADGRQLAVIFALTGKLDFAFLGLEELIKHRRELFNAKVEAGLETATK